MPEIAREPTEMELRVARRIYLALDKFGAVIGDDDCAEIDGTVNLHDLARAAIRATREPTEAMGDAAQREMFRQRGYDEAPSTNLGGYSQTMLGRLYRDAHYAAIDAASPPRDGT